VLYASDDYGEAAWVWFRPKWESGILGTERKDGLHAVECTLFRNETHILSSDLIKAAVDFLWLWNRLTVPLPDGLITGVKSSVTSKRRGKQTTPGWCYLMAGWHYIDHAPGVADVWVGKSWP
jgi:hypothetical protein